MTFQATVALDMGFGVPGELFLDGPTRAQPGIIDSAGPNTVGFVFTKVAATDGHCIVGGTIGEGTPFFGILANPKVYPLLGTTGGGTLAPTLNLPQYASGEFVQETAGHIVALTGAANVGDLVDYDTTTGALSARASGNSFTLAQSTTTVTVTGFVAGGAPIGVGSVFRGTGVLPGTTVTALGSGTGGNGTYTVNTSATLSGVAASSTSLPASGKAQVPDARVTRYSIAGTGLAVISISANGGN